MTWTNEQLNHINNILMYSYSKYVPYANKVMWILKRLKISFFRDNVKTNNNIKEILFNALSPYTLEQDYNGSNTITAIICSGTLNMNPAYIILEIIEKDVAISAFAKEGLIKQHTAYKAVKLIKMILSQCNITYAEG